MAVASGPIATYKNKGRQGKDQTLRDALQSQNGDPPSSIPFWVWLLEDDSSPIALPGKASLYQHDCLHLLLERGFSLEDEAFVVGFTMGNNTETHRLHLATFKLISTTLYPPKYRFTQPHLKVFDLGVLYGEAIKVRNINRIDLKPYLDLSIGELQAKLGICPRSLQTLRRVENGTLLG